MHEYLIFVFIPFLDVFYIEGKGLSSWFVFVCYISIITSTRFAGHSLALDPMKKSEVKSSELYAESHVSTFLRTVVLYRDKWYSEMFTILFHRQYLK